MIQEFNEKNKSIKIWINGILYPREEAKVSVFDSLTQGGDAVWEGIRVYDSRIFCLDEHLNRLFESAKSLFFSDIPDQKTIKEAIFQTLKANNMNDSVHIRLTLTRGEKITSGMNPALNQSGCTLIILPEWKPPIYNGVRLKLITSNIRRNSPLCLDSKIHHSNLINNILAKIEANNADVDDAIMLDLNGFVAETNSTNIFMVKDKEVFTPFPDACLPGITRKIIIDLCNKNKIPIYERNLSITEFYNADEVFITGTMGEIGKVIEIDKREIKNKGSVSSDLYSLFLDLTKKGGEKIPL